jgi:asparagine synthase (glutamine-hydrolysing)
MESGSPDGDTTVPREKMADVSGLLAFVGGRALLSDHRDALAAALESLHHRGPDDTEISEISDSIFLGFKRLSTLDIYRGRQPMKYPADGFDAGRYWIVFDGEIHNFAELRDELVAEHGATFATEGDTEVLAAAYHYWGDQAVTRLRGMFAVVIVDTMRHSVWGARDQYGIKPLFYLVTGDGLYLASEQKALLPFVPGRAGLPGGDAVDPANLSYYLTYQYVPETGSMHRGIGRVRAGESFSFLPGGVFATRRYHQPQFRPTAVSDPEALYRDVRAAVRESVHLHMRSDVQVGAFLSSGIDSTGIVALAREVNPDLVTFTVGFDVEGYSEIDIAEASAHYLGVRSISTRVTAAQMMAAMPTIVWHLDDPVADPSLVPLYFLAKKASEHVKVVLSGDGADEIFGGNRIYREPLALSGVAALPDGVQRGLRKVARRMPQGVKGKSFIERGTTPIETRYYGNARIFREREKRLLMRHYDENVHYTDVTAPIYAEAAALDDVTKMQYIDLFTWLRGDILVKADRMSMAHGLQLRTPYLDRGVFEIASRLPIEEKLPPKSDATKHALRRALDGIVPAGIVNRQTLGFPVPIRVWLKSEMYDWAHDILSTSGAGELLDLGYARSLLVEHRDGEHDHSRKIWTVLVFCIWYGVFIDKTMTP